MSRDLPFTHPTRVLIADDDPVARTMLVETLQGRGYVVLEAADGAAAWAIASGSAPPHIILLDWMMPRMSGIDVCRRLRALPGRTHVHVLLMTARNRHSDMLEGFAAGADDFLTKPLAAAEIVVRVQAADRALAAAGSSPGLAEALREAATSPGGDLLVRSGAEVGRVMFHAGRVAWVHLSTEPGSLHDLMRDQRDINREDITAVLEECFSAGRHFADVLVEWEMITATALEDRLRAWLSPRLESILTRRFDVAMFVPQPRRYSAMTFALHELLPAPLLLTEDLPPAPEAPPPAAFEPALQRCLDEAIAIEGAQAAALLDSDRGAFLARRGLSLDEGLVHALTRLLHSEDVDDCVDDILVSRGSRLHLLQRTPRSGCYLFVELERAVCNLGLARTRLQTIARRLAQADADDEP